MRAFVLIGGLLVAAAGSSRAQDTQEWDWHGAVAAGKELAVRGTNGDIVARHATGKEVVVHATKRGRRDDPADVKITVVQDAEGVTICAVYPPSRRGRENECLSGGGGRNNTDNNDVTVNFTVDVPDGVNFVGMTTNGDIEANDMPANAEVHTTNGDATLSAQGHGSATTTNGSVHATLGRADWTGGAEFTTTNGSVTVTLPANVNADVSAETTNGDISTDFPLTVQGRFGPRRLHGTIGTGGTRLVLRTTNGSIELRKH